MSPITISVVVFACVFGGGLLGVFIYTLVPKEHLDSDSKEAVRLGMALVGTTVALVLGLLIASARAAVTSSQLSVASFLRFANLERRRRETS